MSSNLTADLRLHLAVVTGASGGIGKATCLALAGLGCSIAVHYHSSEDKATGLVKELKDKGVRAEAFKADLTKYDEVANLKNFPALHQPRMLSLTNFDTRHPRQNTRLQHVGPQPSFFCCLDLGSPYDSLQ